jgi:hypothetical protein
VPIKIAFMRDAVPAQLWCERATYVRVDSAVTRTSLAAAARDWRDELLPMGNQRLSSQGTMNELDNICLLPITATGTGSGLRGQG